MVVQELTRDAGVDVHVLIGVGKTRMALAQLHNGPFIYLYCWVQVGVSINSEPEFVFLHVPDKRYFCMK
jgi:hypothetical protein